MDNPFVYLDKEKIKVDYNEYKVVKEFEDYLNFIFHLSSIQEMVSNYAIDTIDLHDKNFSLIDTNKYSSSLLSLEFYKEKLHLLIDKFIDILLKNEKVEIDKYLSSKIIEKIQDKNEDKYLPLLVIDNFSIYSSLISENDEVSDLSKELFQEIVLEFFIDNIQSHNLSSYSNVKREYIIIKEKTNNRNVLEVISCYSFDKRMKLHDFEDWELVSNIKPKNLHGDGVDLELDDKIIKFDEVVSYYLLEKYIYSFILRHHISLFKNNNFSENQKKLIDDYLMREKVFYPVKTILLHEELLNENLLTKAFICEMIIYSNILNEIKENKIIEINIYQDSFLNRKDNKFVDIKNKLNDEFSKVNKLSEKTKKKLDNIKNKDELVYYYLIYQLIDFIHSEMKKKTIDFYINTIYSFVDLFAELKED